MTVDLYIDIDGVLLTKTGLMAEGLEEFLEYAINNFNCYWLTTHCKGVHNKAIEHLQSKGVTEKVLKLAEKIKSTDWGTYKTEGINFDREFLWLDDNLFIKEREDLIKRDSLSKLVQVDLNSRPDQLLSVLNQLKQLKGQS